MELPSAASDYFTSTMAVTGLDGALTLGLVLGAVPVLLLWRRLRGTGEKKKESFPEDGVWTLPLLSRFDGVQNPLCMGVCGKVVDVSSSENIKHGEGYGKLWAGNDATYALATLSLKPEDANRLDFKLSDFTADQHKALAGWYKHFTTKYTIVGRLAEYDGWDFSSVEEDAKAETPFGAKADTDSSAAAPATPAAAAAAKAGEGMVLAKGDRVRLKDVEGRADLEGATAVLQGFNPKEGGFEVLVEGKGETVVVKPVQLEKV